jgi:multidrug transporter EmrE-like cation transporter
MRFTINIATLLLFVAILAAGQMLFKHSADVSQAASTADRFARLLQTPSFYIALTLYGSSTFLWVWILSRVPLSLAYPFTGVTIVLIPLLSNWVFGEVITPAYWIGAVLIFVGVVIIQLSA